MTESISQQVNALQQAYSAGASHDHQWRVDQLKAIARMLQEQEQVFFDALKSDLNKAPQEAFTTEVGVLTGEVKHTLKKLKAWMKPKRVATPVAAMPGSSRIQPEPLGAVLIIGAWNYPLQLALSPLIAAVAAGNAVVLKPSELSPATSRALAELLPQYVDSQLIKVIEGALQESTELLAERWDHILYTGGGNVGKVVMTAAAKHLTPVTLELGGKSPCLIDSNVDVELAAKRIAWGKWLNAGQTCVAPDYILTTPEMVQPLVDALRDVIEEFFGADPAQSDSYARIVNQRHSLRLSEYLEDGEVVIGGQCDIENCYIAPTVLKVDRLDAPLMQEEIFGPLLPIIAVDDMGAAVAFVKQREKPLALYLFSRDKQLQQVVQRTTSAGNMCINDTIMFMTVHGLPFGGVGASGMGCYHGEHGFKTFSHYKSVLKRANFGELPLRYAPYKKIKMSLLRKLL